MKSIMPILFLLVSLPMVLAPTCEEPPTETVTITGQVFNRVVAVEGVQVTLSACAPRFDEIITKSGEYGMYEFVTARAIPMDEVTGVQTYIISASYGRKTDCAYIDNIPNELEVVEQNLNIATGTTCPCPTGEEPVE